MSEKLSKEYLATLTLDNPITRWDEHQRSCGYCAQHEELCLRGQVLKQVYDETLEAMKS